MHTGAVCSNESKEEKKMNYVHNFPKSSKKNDVNETVKFLKPLAHAHNNLETVHTI